MLKAFRLGRSALEERGAGGMGGSPGEDMWAVLDGSSVGRRRGRDPGPDAAWEGPLPFTVPEREWDVPEVLLLLLFRGGEYGGIDSPFDTVV